jgi:hypothetical protein
MQSTIDRFDEVLSRIEYPGYSFVVSNKGENFFMQVRCTALCNVTNAPMRWRGRKWLLSRHMVDGEIVQTALKAVFTALEHEAREKFKYRGQAIFDPHYDIEQLVNLRKSQAAIKERTPAED